jgi:hypothetical protein
MINVILSAWVHALAALLVSLFLIGTTGPLIRKVYRVVSHRRG